MLTTEKVLYLDSQTLLLLLEVWAEAFSFALPGLPPAQLQAVRATVEESLQTAKDITVVKDENGRILAFMYIRGDKIEMLYVTPNAMGQGIGKMLVAYAISAQKAKRIDIPEENENARTFFESFGFKAVGRADTDTLGNLLPTLCMRLAD